MQSKREANGFRARLIAFYRHYNPACLQSVDVIVDTYAGREDDIFRVLVDKYGPELRMPESTLPAVDAREVSQPASPCRTSPTEVRAPSRDGHTAPPAGKGESTAVKPNPSPDWKARFFNFFSYYRPDKLKGLDMKLRMKAGCEEQWMAILVAKYGKEPPPRANPVNLTPAANVTPARTASFRSRLVALYERHNPAMLPFIDEIIRTCDGNENDLLKELDARYSAGAPQVSVSAPRSRPCGSSRAYTVSPRPSRSSSRSPPAVAPQNSTAVSTLTGRAQSQGRPSASKTTSLRERRADHGVPRRQRSASREAGDAAENKRVVAELARALEQKTTEILNAQQAKEALEAEVQSLRHSLADAEAQLHCERKAQRKQKLENSELVAALDRAKELAEGLRQDIATHKATIQQLRSQLEEAKESQEASRRTVRTLTLQKEQLLADVQHGEDRGSELAAHLAEERSRAKMYLQQLGSMKLLVAQPQDESAFCAIVKDIEEGFRKHYEEELARFQTEMDAYYVYAEKQISDRDALIEELSQ